MANPFKWHMGIHNTGTAIFVGFQISQDKALGENTSNYNKCTSTYRRVKIMLWEPQAEEEGTP